MATGPASRCPTWPGIAGSRPYLLYNRALLGDLSRVAARTITAFIRTTVGERDLSVGIVASIQTHGSLANWHPHLHLLVTDGGFRADVTFLALLLAGCHKTHRDVPPQFVSMDLVNFVGLDSRDVSSLGSRCMAMTYGNCHVKLSRHFVSACRRPGKHTPPILDPV